MPNQKIEDLIENAFIHWRSEGSEKGNYERAVRVHASLQRVEAYFAPKRKAKKKVANALVDFRRAIGGDDFEAPDRKSLNADHTRLQTIREKADTLKKLY